MFTNLSDILSLALAIVAVSTLAGYGLLRGSVQNLREQLKDEREARSSLSARHDALRTEATDLRGKVKVLESIVTGEVHWVALGDKLDEHHKEATEYWTKAGFQSTTQEQLLGEIRDLLRSSR